MVEGLGQGRRDIIIQSLWKSINNLSFQAGDNSGYVGAAIVGVFIIIVAGWYGTRMVVRKRKATSIPNDDSPEEQQP